MKRISIVVVIFLLFFRVVAQEKYGLNEQECKENLSMFREYYKQKNYIDAYAPWMWAFKNCPKSSQNIYRNGPKIIKERIKVDKSKKLAYIDTLMLVFDQRIEYFGNEGYVLGLKGFELVMIDKNRSAEACVYLKSSIDMDGNKSSVQAVYGYMKAIVNLEKKGERSKSDVLDTYALLSEIIDFNIINKSKATKNFIKYSEKVENLFTPYANCKDLISLFSLKFDDTTDDINFLEKVIKLLSDKNCIDSELYYNVSLRLYNLNPSASSANQMSKMSLARGKKADAILYAKKAVDTELDSNTKAKYYLSLADAYRSSGSYSSSREAVYSALKLRSNWGMAYLNLGNIYVSAASSCGNDFENKTVYWIAVDAFKKALLDEETSERASRSINTYSKYFPTKEACFFNGITADSNYTVGCWIKQNTIARTSD